MAQYVSKHSVKEEDFMREDYWSEGDYCEKTDNYYTSEGWYEYQTEPDVN